MYVKKYAAAPQTIMVDGFDLPIPMPVQPNLRDIENYGKSISSQIFRRTEIPKSVRDYDVALKEYLRDYKEKTLKAEYFAKIDMVEVTAFIEQEWHRRRNGLWVFIKGNPYYIPGQAYFFFNYWETEVGGLPEFRMEALEYFWVWDFAERSKDCLGLDVIKCRRLGVTEKALCAGYEYCTRYKNSWFGMQNVNDTDAYLNFVRVTTANKEMIFFFKPIHDQFMTSDSPKEALIFKYPNWFPKWAGCPELRSRIDYKATRFKMYDGKRMRFFHLDEPGKIPDSDMPVLKQWDVIKFTLLLKNKYVVGKAMLTTTVESIRSGDTVRNMIKLWDDSDPREVGSSGRTKSGLWRYFIDYTRTADIDAWGFHKVEEATALREADIESYIKKGDFDGLADYKRRMPATIHEALSIPASECILYPALLDMQTERLSKDKDLLLQPFKEVRGCLAWTNGPMSRVVFVPDPAGDWHFASHPDTPNNVMFDGQSYSPRQAGVYHIGVDGVDHIRPADRGSLGGLVVYRARNESIENVEVDENGRILNEDYLKTDRFVACYVGRPKKPVDFYDEGVKAAWYFGSKVFAERQKPGIMNHFSQIRMGAFLAFKPKVIRIGARVEKAPGMHTSQSSVDYGIGLLQGYIATKSGAITLTPLLDQYRAFDGENMGKLDLVAASMFALMSAQRRIAQNGVTVGWGENPYDNL